MPLTAVRHSNSTPSAAARSARVECSVVLRTASPTPPHGNGASAEKPELRKRIPRKGCPSHGFNAIPSSRRACNPSGISPSPHALSIGGAAPSATTTRNPLWRAAIPAASPAGPPPITKTSVDFSNRDLTTGEGQAPNRIPAPWPPTDPTFPAPDGGSSSHLPTPPALTPTKDFPPAAGTPRKHPVAHRVTRVLLP